MEPLIKIENAWKIYRLGKVDLTVLRNISLQIEKGEMVVILGPSGSGKSTLLNIISCLDVPTKGSVFLEGQDVSSFTEDGLAEIRNKKIGFVFQQFNLFSHLNAVENVALPMIFQGIPECQRRERAEKILSSFGLEDRFTHRPLELSGGEQQRVAVSRALANNPEIIVADEPTGNVDSKTGEMIMQILRDLNKKEGKTIIIVTHDGGIASYGDKVVNIKDGEIL